MIASKFPSRWEGGLNLTFNLHPQVVPRHGGGQCLWQAAAILLTWHLLSWVVLSLLQLFMQASPETTVSLSVFLFQDACWHPQGDHLVLITEPLKGHKLPLSAMFCTSPKDLDKPTVGLHFLEMQTTESSCVPALAWCAPRLRTSGRASDDKMALVISTCRFPPHREIPLPSPTLGAVLWGRNQVRNRSLICTLLMKVWPESSPIWLYPWSFFWKGFISFWAREEKLAQEIFQFYWMS